jgi:hypothetical protein
VRRREPSWLTAQVTTTPDSVTLTSMEPPGREELRDARTVEIAFALMAGVLVSAVSAVGVLLVGWALGLSGPGWELARRIVLVVALILGFTATFCILWRARRRGL